jgi:hypothetical protein
MTAMRIISRDALPGAVAEMLNATAEASANEGKRSVQRKMIVRTKFTTNSIRQDRHARGSNIAAMYSRAGSISPYLAIHDEGGVKNAESSRVSIPTIQARTSRSIRKSIATRYRMNRLGTLRGNPKYFIGRPSANRGRLGIYERRPGNKLRMIRNLESYRVRIPKTRWWTNAVGRYGTTQFMRAQFERSARRRLARFRGR